VNYPRASDGLWFITQYRRCGMLDCLADDLAVARAVNQTTLYREAARAASVAVLDERRAATHGDRLDCDATDAARRLAAYGIKAWRP
jgi:two-component system, oxyanion-binding sensor